eukprot:3033786-Prymnesium_polylepis.2
MASGGCEMQTHGWLHNKGDELGKHLRIPERALPQRFVVVRQKGDGTAEGRWIPRHQRLPARREQNEVQQGGSHRPDEYHHPSDDTRSRVYLRAA